MPTTAFRILPLTLAVALAACANQNEPQPIRSEPVYDKFGVVQQCVGADGRVYAPRPELLDPCVPVEDCPDPVRIPGTPKLVCTPPPDDCPDPQLIPGTATVVCQPPDDCPDGFYNSAGQFICPAPDRNSSGTSGTRPGTSSGTSGGGASPNDPTGASTAPRN
jgi:hypothetical protein